MIRFARAFNEIDRTLRLLGVEASRAGGWDDRAGGKIETGESAGANLAGTAGVLATPRRSLERELESIEDGLETLGCNLELIKFLFVLFVLLAITSYIVGC